MFPIADYVFSIITAVTNILIVVGIFAAFQQVKAGKEALKAQVLMKLFDEWRDIRIYQAITYINRLRVQWKDTPSNEWSKLAKEWVSQHVGKNTDSQDPDEKRLWNEWEMRRTASQFLAKMGSMIEAGYLSEDDFFGVDPEVGRQLAVLIYIERAVQEHWTQKEQNPIASWDRPFPKWEFNGLWAKYQKWFQIHGQGKLILNPPDWSQTPTATGR